MYYQKIHNYSICFASFTQFSCSGEISWDKYRDWDGVT